MRNEYNDYPEQVENIDWSQVTHDQIALKLLEIATRGKYNQSKSKKKRTQSSQVFFNNEGNRAGRSN